MDLDWIKNIMEERDISQGEIADVLGVSQSKVSKMLNGRMEIKSHEADAIRRHLGFKLPEDLDPGSVEYRITHRLSEIGEAEKTQLVLFLEALFGQDRQIQP